MTATLWELVADVFDPPAGSWKPWPKQQLASRLAGQADELLFGGAAGPGKTAWLLEYAVAQMENHPGNRGAIFRRVYPSLNRTVIPRMKAILAGGRAKWNGTEHTFTFPNGSILECASLQYRDDVFDYQGAEYGFIGFEEVTEFLESQYEYMVQRLRAPADGIRPHAVCTTNPGGAGHRWVKRRWVRPKPDDFDGEEAPPPLAVWRPPSIPGRHTADHPPLTRCFVPATHADNPALLERDPGYISRILGMTNRGLRQAMLSGDWEAIDAVEGALWDASELDDGRISPGVWAQTVRSWQRVIAVDPSDGKESGDEYGVAQCSRGADGVGYVEGSWAWQLSVRKMAEQTVALYHEVGAMAVVVERNHGGRWMMEVFRQVDPYVNVVDVWASDGKRTRAEPVAALFTPDSDATDPRRRFRGRMVGFQPELEEEFTTTTFDPKQTSPNRLDAAVWGLSWLCLGQRQVRNQGSARDARLDGRR